MELESLRWIVLALYTSAGPLLVFAHGFFGAGSAFSGALLVFLTTALCLLGRRIPGLVWPDALFGALLACIAATTIKNGVTADFREYALLILSLAAYVAGRRFGGEGIDKSYILTAGAIIVVGTVATVIALADQWNSEHGKPLLFGQFGAGAVQFFCSLAFLIFSAAGFRMYRRPVAFASFAALVVYAASIVRFGFVALTVSLLVSLFFGQHKKYSRLMALAVIVAFVAGSLLRSSTAGIFFDYGIEVLFPKAHAAQDAAPISPDTCPEVNRFNSIAIRAQLFRDGMRLLPSAGPFGFGLESFPRLSCIEMPVHNSVLQAFIEIGWIGGAAFVLLFLCAWIGLPGLARKSDEALFVLSSLTFTACFSMAHGRLSGDSLLLFFIGYAVGLKETSARAR